MWPSFSLWACKILKIRSCLRRALVPAISRPRASLPSSAMLFSFNSEIVMSSCDEVNFLKGGLGVAEGESELCRGEAINAIADVGCCRSIDVQNRRKIEASVPEFRKGWCNCGGSRWKTPSFVLPHPSAKKLRH